MAIKGMTVQLRATEAHLRERTEAARKDAVDLAGTRRDLAGMTDALAATRHELDDTRPELDNTRALLQQTNGTLDQISAAFDYTCSTLRRHSGAP